MRNWWGLLAAVCLSLTLLAGTPAPAADLKVFSDGPLRTALTRLVSDFRADTGHTVDVVYGTVPALKSKLAAGEKADVLISLAPEIEELAKENRFAATQTSIATIKLGLAVRKGVAAPDIRTLAAFKQTLLRADSVIHNSLASGRAFARQLERIGISEQIKSKIVVIKGNTQLEELARRTGNDVAGGLLTQLMEHKSVQFVGALPQEAQAATHYSAGVFSDTKAPEAAGAFLRFLASTKAVATFVAAGAK